MIFKKTQGGVTLLELMISITLLGIVMLIIFGTMRLGYRSIEKAERTMEFLERLRASLGIIESQLQSQTPLFYERDDEKKVYFAGTNEFIQFSTNYSIWSGQLGYVKVAYNVERNTQGKLTLYATENTISVEDARKTILLDNIDDISFKYFYKDPTAEHGEWRDEWVETFFLPEMVSVNIFDSSKKLTLTMLFKIKNTQLHATPVQPAREPGRQAPKRGGELPRKSS